MANTPPPVPTQSQMLSSQGLVTRPWLSWFTTLGQLFSNIFNQIIQAAGVAVPQEVVLNFLAPLVVTDNPANGSTDVSLPAPAYSVQFGTAQAAATFNDYAAVAVVFATPFARVPQVFTNAANYPRAANAPMSCYATDITETGFTANLACSVPTGGGGATVDNIVAVNWMAIA